MCGINLIFAYGDAPAVDRGELIAVRDAMAPRGPDGAGEWISDDGRVGLGHRRLAIIDLSPGGAQPMHSADRRLTITFNGEIYNYRALRDALIAEGVAFRSDSDTEVLLALYARYGAAMTDHLRGMYTFAIWDAERGGMLLARDPFGIKPLYVADDGRTLRAASQVKALLAGRDIDTAPAPAGHAGFFLLGYVPEPHTLYRGIRALPAGARMWVDAAGARQEVHTDVAALVTRPAATDAGPYDKGALAAALSGSVAAHLVADVPVGVFLSAGMDSTTIAALATEAAKAPLRTVTLGFAEFRGGPHDEVPLAEEVARALGSDHSTVWVTADDFAAEAEQVLAAMDQPSIDGVNVYFVSKVTAGAGLKVALSGLGGDELFAGYPSFRDVPALRRRLGWAAAVPGLGRLARAVATPITRRVSSPKYAGLIEYADSLPRAYLLRRALFMPWEVPLPGDILRQGLADLALDGHMAATAPSGSDRQRVSALELAWYMRGQLLRDADWAGMAHGLEIRVPLVDVALTRALAPMLAADDPPGKRDMAATPTHPLPQAVLDRPKTGFSVPVRDWLLRGVGDRLGMPVDAAARGLRGWAQLVYRASWAG